MYKSTLGITKITSKVRIYLQTKSFHNKISDSNWWSHPFLTSNTFHFKPNLAFKNFE